jgi:hypothetical protein
LERNSQAVLLPRKQPALRYAIRVSKNGVGWLYTGLSLGRRLWRPPRKGWAQSGRRDGGAKGGRSRRFPEGRQSARRRRKGLAGNRNVAAAQPRSRTSLCARLQRRGRASIQTAGAESPDRIEDDLAVSDHTTGTCTRLLEETPRGWRSVQWLTHRQAHGPIRIVEELCACKLPSGSLQRRKDILLKHYLNGSSRLLQDRGENSRVAKLLIEFTYTVF